MLGGLRLCAEVGTGEANVGGLAPRTGEREHIGERDAGPDRSTGRAGTPGLLARELANGDQARAAVAGALERRGYFPLPEHLAQGGEGEVQLALDESVDAQPPGGGFDLRHRRV